MHQGLCLYSLHPWEVKCLTGGRGRFSHVKAYRDVPPKWVSFHQESLDKGPILVKKILRRGPHFTKIAEKNYKIAVFEAEKSLEMGPDLRKILGSIKTRQIFHFFFFFLAEKSL